MWLCSSSNSLLTSASLCFPNSENTTTFQPIAQAKNLNVICLFLHHVPPAVCQQASLVLLLEYIPNFPLILILCCSHPRLSCHYLLPDYCCSLLIGLYFYSDLYTVVPPYRGDTFQHPQWMPETADSSEPYTIFFPIHTVMCHLTGTCYEK